MIINNCRGLKCKKYGGEEEWFRTIFARPEKDKAIQNENKFFLSLFIETLLLEKNEDLM